MNQGWTDIVTALAALVAALAAVASALVALAGFVVSLISAASSCGSTTIVFITAIFVGVQTYLGRRAANASAHKTAFDILSNEHVLAARRTVFTQLDGVDFHIWTDEQTQKADETCRAYDAVGQMVDYGFLKKEFIAEHWAQSLEESWRILKPYVNHLRETRNALEIWDNFETLAELAPSYRKRLR